jgi:hypothetical protein
MSAAQRGAVLGEGRPWASLLAAGALIAAAAAIAARA